MILQVIASVFLIIAIAAFFGLTPERITDDLMSLMTPNDTMRDKARNIRGNKKKHGLYRILVRREKLAEVLVALSLDDAKYFRVGFGFYIIVFHACHS